MGDGSGLSKVSRTRYDVMNGPRLCGRLVTLLDLLHDGVPVDGLVGAVAAVLLGNASERLWVSSAASR